MTVGLQLGNLPLPDTSERKLESKTESRSRLLPWPLSITVYFHICMAAETTFGMINDTVITSNEIAFHFAR